MLMMDQLAVEAGLLKPLETAMAPGSVAPVRVRDCFKKNSRVRISIVFHEFEKRFFDKIENPAPEAAYRKYRLLADSADRPLINELGGETEVEGTFMAAFALLQRQPKGEPGFLQTNGYANIFYARDKDGMMCAIRIGWASDGWVVDAIPVADPEPWHGDHLIFRPFSQSAEAFDFCVANSAR